MPLKEQGVDAVHGSQAREVFCWLVTSHEYDEGTLVATSSLATPAVAAREYLYESLQI